MSIIKDIAQLFMRGLMSYGFWTPFVAKLQHMESFAGWLARMHFPTPVLDAWLVVVLQGSAVICLLVGFATRALSVLLAYHMLIGLLAVHWPHGFSAVNGGYEIPLYYVLMLLTLAVYGPGRLSLDACIRRRVVESN